MNAECASVCACERADGGTDCNACCVPPEDTACANRSTWLAGTFPDAARYEVIRLWKIAPSAAMPVAIPTCRNVLLIPDAIPARLGSTTLTDVEASGALTKPMPTPATRKPA